MTYDNYNLSIISDFEIRNVREDNEDVDLLIPINNRSLNILFKDMPDYIHDKFQFPSVYGVMIRISKAKDNNIATLHILRNIDLYSSSVNFELEYEALTFNFMDCTLYCELTFEKAGIR